MKQTKTMTPAWAGGENVSSTAERMYGTRVSARVGTSSNRESGLGTLRGLRRRLGRELGNLRASVGFGSTERREARQREFMAWACCPDDELAPGYALEVE